MLVQLLQRALYQRKRGAKLVGYVGEEHQFVFRELTFHLNAVAQGIELGQHPPKEVADSNPYQQVNQYGPMGLPEGRLHPNGKHRFLRAPQTSRRTGFGTQHIATGRQIFVGSIGPGRRGAPLLVVVVQLVAIAHRPFVRVVKDSEVHLHGVLTMGKFNLACIGYGFLKR